MIFKVKFAIGILLIICTCLPLGSCQKNDILPLTKEAASVQKENTETIIINTSKSETDKTDYLIPIAEVDFNEPDPGSWAFLLSFLWQIPFLFMTQKKCNTLKRIIITRAVELFLALFSAFIIYSYVFKLFYTPMFFGYAALLMITVYSLLIIFELVVPLKRVTT